MKPVEPVLVTGALGFIGRRTVESLLDLGVRDVRAFDLPGLSMPAEWQGRVEYIPGDISYQPDVDRAMGGVATVIHLAAMVGDWIPLARHQRVTLDGSRYLFDAALQQNARVVLSSSIVVYGDRLAAGPCHEEVPWGQPLGPYSICKQAQEKMAWRYCNKHGMPLSVVRPANVYGAGSRPWVHDVVDALRWGMPMLVSGGNFNGALVHVDNLAELLVLCASHEKARGEAFNGADGNTVTWRQYFSDIAAALDLPPPRSVPRALITPAAGVVERAWSLLGVTRRPPVTREALNLVSAKTLIPIDKARSVLGYTPRVSYETGIREVRQYVKALATGGNLRETIHS
ncbi:MAG: NAD(P)-dependent oxidoreductase [Ketobacteraceae bacterium]|nr:NAD(P)-dependent oxidoreductase [Ketobacteraceae bacterium]